MNKIGASIDNTNFKMNNISFTIFNYLFVGG